MGKYIGDTFKIICGTKGINNNLNMNAIEPDELIWPSKNIDLSKGGWGRRGGTAKINDTVVSDAPRIMGLCDFLKIDGSQHIVFATSDGKIYKNSTETIKTGLGSSKYSCFETFDNELIFCNGHDKPTKWDGEAASTTDFVIGEKAVGVITMSGLAVADETFFIDDHNFTWKANRGGEGEVKIGGNISQAVANIVIAVKADLTTVVATDRDGYKVHITAVSTGEAGGSIIFTEASTNMDIDGSGTLSGGIDGELPADWMGEKATGVITMSGVAVLDETFVVDDHGFTWKANRGGEGEVKLGGNAAEAVENIIIALNLDCGNSEATAGDGDTVNVTAVLVGEAGNSIVFTEASTNMAMNGSGTLSGGVDEAHYPSVMIKHGRGNSERMWAFGCTSKPYTVYVSPNGKGTCFSDTDTTTFSIDTGDDAGIMGGTVFKDRLILFGKRNTFVMDDEDTDISNWGYTAFTREGGVAHQRLVISTPNDVICMMEDGEIYSLAVTDKYGDYEAGSITKSKFMDRWIQDNVELSLIEHFHGIYDPVKRVVKIFVVRTGQTEIDTALVYYIDTGEWMIEDNLDYSSGYSASSSALIRVSPGVYEIYTGDYSGFIWHLEQASKNDDSNGYESSALTPYLYFENPRASKLYQRCWIDLEPDNPDNLTIRYIIDAIYSTTVSISMSGEAGLLGSFILGHSVLGSEKMARTSFPIGRIGEKIQFEFKNSTADEDFFISQIMIDHLSLGVGLGR